MTLRLCVKVLLHMWSYDFYDTTLSTDYNINVIMIKTVRLLYALKEIISQTD